MRYTQSQQDAIIGILQQYENPKEFVVKISDNKVMYVANELERSISKALLDKVSAFQIDILKIDFDSDTYESKTYYIYKEVFYKTFNEYNNLDIETYCQKYGEINTNVTSNNLVDVFDVHFICSIEKLYDFILAVEQSRLKHNEVDSIISEFMYNVADRAKTVKLLISCGIEDFTSIDCEEDSIEIVTIDTKETLITIAKTINDYRFVSNITTNSKDNYYVNAVIKSSEHFNKLVNQTIESLKDYEEYRKYAEDLENILIC